MAEEIFENSTKVILTFFTSKLKANSYCGKTHEKSMF